MMRFPTGRGTMLALLSYLLLYFNACTSEPTSTTTTTVPEVAIPGDSLATGLRSYGEQLTSVKDPFVRRFSGRRSDGELEDWLLINWGDGYLSGHRLEEKGEWQYELQGELALDESVLLRVYDGEEERPERYQFQLDNLDTIRGEWRASEEAVAVGFQILARSGSGAEPPNWSGTWHYNSIWDAGTLVIGDVRDSSFYFALSVVRFTHSGEIDGRARIQGDSAIYHARVYDAYSDEACVLHFQLLEDRIELQQRSSTSACGFGMRAYASGSYDNRVIEAEAQLSFGDESRAFLDAAQHDAFQSWLGKENYAKVAENMQMSESQAYQSPQEGLNGILTEGLVMGLFTTDEAILLHDRRGGFWAATIDPLDSEAGTYQVLYFTNQQPWKQKLPQAFERWRQSFPEYPIVFND